MRPAFTLTESVVVDKLFSFNYHEFSKDFVFSGEAHDFWELCYVDTGELLLIADGRRFHLKQGDIIFLKPGIFHSSQSYNNTPPSLINISFHCSSPYMETLEDKILCVSDAERNLLAEVMAEGLYTFSTSVNRTSVYPHEYRKERVPFGSEQLVKINLEKLFISLIRNHSATEPKDSLSSIYKEANHDELFVEIDIFLKKELQAVIQLDVLSHKFRIGKSQLKKLFKEKAGMGVMQYWRKLKMEQAKIMLRDGDLTVTEISGKLGYSSIHYFSRQFKQETGIAPTEYAKSAIARSLGIS